MNQMTKEIAIAIASEPSCFFDRTAQEARRKRVRAVYNWILEPEQTPYRYQHPQWSSVLCFALGGPQRLEIDEITLSLEITNSFLTNV